MSEFQGAGLFTMIPMHDLEMHQVKKGQCPY